MMKAVTKDIEAKTVDKEQYAKHIKALLLDRGAQYLDVLPFWDSNNINLLFDEEEGYMSFAPEQKHSVVSLLERAVVITKELEPATVETKALPEYFVLVPSAPCHGSMQ